MARRNKPERRRRDDDIGAKMAKGALAGCAVAGAIVFGIVAMIAIMIAIRFNEARRNGEGPWAKPPKIEIDPPDNPPQFNPPPVEGPPPVQGPQPIERAAINAGPDGISRTQVVGGGNDPQVEMKAPAGGMLNGLELAVVNNDCI